METQEIKQIKKKPGRRKQTFNIIQGIEATPEDKYVVFGNFCLNKPALFKEGRLVVKYNPSLTSVGNLPNKQVSNIFRDIIKTILDEHKINHRLLSQLNDEEKDLFSNLIKRAGLETRLGLHGYRSLEQDKQYERFELLKGQVIAGNNNKDILKELKTMVIKFMNDGTLTKAEGGQILLELMSII